MACDGCNCFLSFWAFFCTFTSITAWIMKISKKEKNACNTSVPKIIIICYTVPEIWCVTDAIVIFHFGLFFVHLSLTARKMKISKKKKKKTPGDVILRKCTKTRGHVLYFPEIWCVTDVVFFFFILGDIFPFYPLTALKMKISKKWKKSWRYHHFTQVYQKSWSYATLFLKYGMWHM